MLKIAAIVLSVLSGLASAYLWTRVLPSMQDEINELKQEIQILKSED